MGIGLVRTVFVNNEVYFVTKDIVNALGYKMQVMR